MTHLIHVHVAAVHQLMRFLVMLALMTQRMIRQNWKKKFAKEWRLTPISMWTVAVSGATEGLAALSGMWLQNQARVSAHVVAPLATAVRGETPVRGLRPENGAQKTANGRGPANNSWLNANERRLYANETGPVRKNMDTAVY